MNRPFATLITLTILHAVTVGPALADAPATKGDIQRLEKQIESLRMQISEIQKTMRSHGASPAMGSTNSAHAMPPQAAMPSGNMPGQQPPMMDDDMDMPMGNPPPANQAPMGQMPSGGGMGDM